MKYLTKCFEGVVEMDDWLNSWEEGEFEIIKLDYKYVMITIKYKDK